MCHIVAVFESQPGSIHLHQTHFLRAQQLSFGPGLSFCADQKRTPKESDRMSMEETLSVFSRSSVSPLSQ